MSTDLLIGEEPRRKQGGIWAYVSPSRLSKWLSCPLAYRLAYIDGHRPPAADQRQSVPWQGCPRRVTGRLSSSPLGYHLRSGRCLPPPPGIVGNARGRRGT